MGRCSSDRRTGGGPCGWAGDQRERFRRQPSHDRGNDEHRNERANGSLSAGSGYSAAELPAGAMIQRR